MGQRAHLKATGSGKTTCRRPGPGDRAGEEVSTEREPSSLISPGKGVPSRGVVAARVEFLMAASRAWVTSSSLWARPSGRLSRKDMVNICSRLQWRQSNAIRSLPSCETAPGAATNESRQTSSTGTANGAWWKADTGWLLPEVCQLHVLARQRRSFRCLTVRCTQRRRAREVQGLKCF